MTQVSPAYKKRLRVMKANDDRLTRELNRISREVERDIAKLRSLRKGI